MIKVDVVKSNDAIRVNVEKADLNQEIGTSRSQMITRMI
jgi:hypothetical protein